MTDIVTYCDVNNCTECPRYGDDCDGSAERLYTHEEAWRMCDLISRADAIELLTKIVFDEPPYLDSESLCRIYAKEQINTLPSADAVQGWMPCSDRLPNESGEYLATIPLDADETYVEVLTFHKGRFYEDDDEWGATYHDDVLAWMPLPTPYKGGENE